MTTSGIERLSNAIPDLPLPHESVLINSINYRIHRVFFWKTALSFYIVSQGLIPTDALY